MYQPVVPLSGIAGWNFLQATYDRQFESFTDSVQVKRDKDYMLAKLSEPMAVEDFLDDPRLMRVTMTAFDLGGEEWKRGFVDKVLSEVGDPESTFLQRLNNPQYTRFAEALSPQNGIISISEEQRADIGSRFEAVSFKVSVGEIDNSMRLALNYQSEISEVATAGSSNDAILFRLLGSVPMRSVLETALNLPSDIQKLPIEKQAEMLEARIESQFGIRDMSALAEPENVEKVIQRYHAINSLSSGISALTPGAAALTILSGVGGGASQNLFLSNFL